MSKDIENSPDVTASTYTNNNPKWPSTYIYRPFNMYFYLLSSGFSDSWINTFYRNPGTAEFETIWWDGNGGPAITEFAYRTQNLIVETSGIYNVGFEASVGGDRCICSLVIAGWVPSGIPLQIIYCDEYSTVSKRAFFTGTVNLTAGYVYAINLLQQTKNPSSTNYHNLWHTVSLKKQP